MNIGVACRELGAVDIRSLRDAVLEQDEKAWSENQIRQAVFDVHQLTQSIVLLFMDLDSWPRIVVSREPGWARLSDVAMPLIDGILERSYPPGGQLIRAMVARLRPGGKIMPHVDKHPSFHAGHRIHVPLTTNSRVRFVIDGVPRQFEPGQAYEINNQKAHSVANKGATDRLHLIFDYVPPAELAKLHEG